VRAPTSARRATFPGSLERAGQRRLERRAAGMGMRARWTNVTARASFVSMRLAMRQHLAAPPRVRATQRSFARECRRLVPPMRRRPRERVAPTAMVATARRRATEVVGARLERPLCARPSINVTQRGLALLRRGRARVRRRPATTAACHRQFYLARAFIRAPCAVNRTMSCF
jgi:hypothetical protein